VLTFSSSRRLILSGGVVPLILQVRRRTVCASSYLEWTTNHLNDSGAALNSVQTPYITHRRRYVESCYVWFSNLYLDPEMATPALPTLFLFLGLLLSDVQSTKAFSFHYRSSLNFAYRLNTIFSTLAPCRIFKLSPN